MRLDALAAAPELLNEVQRQGIALSKASNFDTTIIELVKVRASQINGCANCLNMHAQEARDAGETQQRLDVLAGWREAPMFTDRERAALGWTEVMTRLSERPELDKAYEMLNAHFTPVEQVKLMLAINMINAWNRLAVGFGVFADAATIARIQAARKVAA